VCNSEKHFAQKDWISYLAVGKVRSDYILPVMLIHHYVLSTLDLEKFYIASANLKYCGGTESVN
jgi:hypothetical protein